MEPTHAKRSTPTNGHRLGASVPLAGTASWGRAGRQRRHPRARGRRAACAPLRDRPLLLATLVVAGLGFLRPRLRCAWLFQGSRRALQHKEPVSEVEEGRKGTLQTPVAPEELSLIGRVLLGDAAVGSPTTTSSDPLPLSAVSSATAARCLVAFFAFSPPTGPSPSSSFAIPAQGGSRAGRTTANRFSCGRHYAPVLYSTLPIQASGDL